MDTATTLGLGLTPWPAGLPEYWFHLHGRAFTAGEWPTLDVNPLAGDLRSVLPAAVASRFMPRPNPLPDLGAWLQGEYQGLDVPLGRFLRDNGAPDAAMPYIEMGNQFDSLDDTSALWQLRAAKFASLSMESALASKSPFRYFINGGTSRLTDAMAASLKSPVRLGHDVVAIDNSADGVTAECGNGHRFRALTAICAVPLPVLRKIAISPVLPGRAAEAVASIPYGSATSVVLHVKDRFWEVDGMPPNIWSDLPVQRAFLNPSPTGEGEHLWVFTTGRADLARRGWPDDELGRFVLAELNRVRPSTRGRLEVAGVRSFTRDPLTLGTYASRAPGQIRRFGNVLSEPSGRLYFAGEHTAVLNSGMEAAMESGERAALAML
jgi:monoamine oxidase